MAEEPLENPQWDSRCKQCGLCCFEKFEDKRGNIFYTQTPCRYLDVVSRQCTIYERRLIINPVCIKLTPELVPTLRWLPTDCGYRVSSGDDEEITKTTTRRRFFRKCSG